MILKVFGCGDPISDSCVTQPNSLKHQETLTNGTVLIGICKDPLMCPNIYFYKKGSGHNPSPWSLYKLERREQRLNLYHKMFSRGVYTLELTEIGCPRGYVTSTVLYRVHVLVVLSANAVISNREFR